MDKKTLEFLREQYPPGTRVVLREMRDPYSLPPGTRGMLDRIDDAGTFQVSWDNGSSLGVTPGEARFQMLPPEQTNLKLYMPLRGELFEENEYGWDEEPYLLDGQELSGYENTIALALKRYGRIEETERGLMNWYDKADRINEKVQSAKFEVEYREGQLWGVARCQVYGTLQPEELETLKEYLTGQASDGWGEGFEQQDIRVEGGVLNVHLWSYKNWSIQTEEERFGGPDQSEDIQQAPIEPQF